MLHSLWFFCPVVAVVMLESQMARCVQCEEEAASIIVVVSVVWLHMPPHHRTNHNDVF